MKVQEVTDKNIVWQSIAGKDAIAETTNLETKVNEYFVLMDAVFSSSLIKNPNLPGLSEIKTAIKSLTKELNDYPDQTDPDIILVKNKIIDLEDKVTFINTCDAMIHARSDGETFGLAVGEFSSCNKPIITCKSAMDNSHIDILGEKGIIYGSKESLIKIFKNIKNIINSRSDWNAYTEYSPENVMEKFFKVFIDSSKIIDYNKINYIDMNRSCISTSNKNDPNLIIVSVFLDIGRDNWDKYERTTQLYINSLFKTTIN